MVHLFIYFHPTLKFWFHGNGGTILDQARERKPALLCYIVQQTKVSIKQLAELGHFKLKRESKRKYIALAPQGSSFNYRAHWQLKITPQIGWTATIDNYKHNLSSLPRSSSWNKLTHLTPGRYKILRISSLGLQFLIWSVQTKSSEQVVSSRYFHPIFDNLEIQFLQFVNITLSGTTTENVRKVIL